MTDNENEKSAPPADAALTEERRWLTPGVLSSGGRSAGNAMDCWRPVLVTWPALAGASGAAGHVDLRLSLCEELHDPGAKGHVDLVGRACAGRLHELLGCDRQHV